MNLEEATQRWWHWPLIAFCLISLGVVSAIAGWKGGSPTLLVFGVMTAILGVFGSAMPFVRRKEEIAWMVVRDE